MTFRRLDADAFAADKPLSSAHLTYLRDCVAACRSERLGAASVGYDVRDAPILTGVGNGATGERGVLLYLWRKSRPEVTELTVRIRGENPSGQSVYVGCFAMGASTLFGGGAVPVTESGASELSSVGEEQEIATTVTWGQTDGSWSLNVGSIQDDLIVVGITAKSDFGDTEQLYDDNLVVDDTTGLTGIEASTMRVETDPNASWDATTAQAVGFLPYRLVFGVVDAANYNPATFTEDTSARTYNNATVPLPDPQHLLCVRAGSTTADYFIWPGVPFDVGVNGTTDALGRQEMGYINLYAVHVEETDVDTFSLGSNALASAVPASASRVQQLNAELEDVFVLQDGPIAIGQSTDDRQDSVFSVALHKGGHAGAAVDTSTWPTLQRWAVGGPRLLFRDEDDSSSTTRNTYVVDALIVWLTRRQDWVQSKGTLLFRLVLEDEDGSGNTVTGDEVEIREARSVLYAGTGQGARMAADVNARVGYLLGLRQGAADVYHNLRDCWPESVVPDLNVYHVQVAVTDTGNTSQTVPRLLALQAQIEPLGLENFSTTANVSSITVVASLVSYLRTGDPALLGGA